jgi:hypothetical protein
LYIDNSVGDLKNDVWHKVIYDGIDIPMVRKILVFFSLMKIFDFYLDL